MLEVRGDALDRDESSKDLKLGRDGPALIEFGSSFHHHRWGTTNENSLD